MGGGESIVEDATPHQMNKEYSVYKQDRVKPLKEDAVSRIVRGFDDQDKEETPKYVMKIVNQQNADVAT